MLEQDHQHCCKSSRRSVWQRGEEDRESLEKDEDMQRMRGRLNRALERRNASQARQINDNIDLVNDIAESIEENNNARKEIKEKLEGENLNGGKR